MRWIAAFLVCALSVAGTCLRAQVDLPEPYGYLLERVTVPADNGTLSFSPATRVFIVREKAGGRVTVRVSQREFDVAASQLTRDPSVAQALLSKVAAEKKGISRTGGKPGETPAAPARTAVAANTTGREKLLALQKQDLQIQQQMERVSAAMQNIPYKLKPWSPLDFANNKRHDELKTQWESLKRQHDKILEQGLQVKREMKHGG